MSRDLVIIEAPGKLRTLHRVFEQVGLHTNICATIGHILENPLTLKDIAIEKQDGKYSETKRLPFREDAYRYLCDQVKQCTGRIIIATDNDQEGHVIAQDVTDLVNKIAPTTTMYRMLVGGLDQESIHTALSNLSSINPRAAVPGTVRRISDRIIGATMSDFELNKPVGRVQSALLGLCEVKGLAHSKMQVRLPCTDGGKPFVGELPVYGANTPAKMIAAMGGLDLQPAPVINSTLVQLGTPLSYGDALINLHRHLSLDVEKVADLLQKMYEAGDISYARTSSRGLTQAGIESVARIARIKTILAFKKDNLPRIEDGSPHEAIRILNEELLKKIDIGKPLKLLDSDRDAALSFIARSSLEAGIPVQRDYPDTLQLPNWARVVDWKRDTRKTVLPWRYPDATQVSGRDIKAALVEEMMISGIGRPSTYAQHAARFSERDLLDYKFELTSKGKTWLEHAPDNLKFIETSVHIEQLLDDSQLDISKLVDQVITIAVGEDKAKLEAIYEKLESPQDLSEDPENIDEDEYRYRPSF